MDLQPFVEDIDPGSKWLLRGLDEKYIYGTCSADAEKFTCCVKNKHLLYTLFYLLDKESGV
jgi:hypothetical protein